MMKYRLEKLSFEHANGTFIKNGRFMQITTANLKNVFMKY